MKTIRIFISSPGDVQEERERARAVVHQLRRRYAGRLDLQALLWEDLPLQADMSFQQGIDVVLAHESGVDVAVFILWSRLGSPTGPLAMGEEGRPYRSGTEREWDLMWRARNRPREGAPPRPSIFVYTRQDDISFEERMRGKKDEEKKQEIEQKLLVRQFIKEEFHDAESNVNIRAYHSFDQPTTFARQLRTHLTNLLDLEADDAMGEPAWSIADHGPPFRGLDVFEYFHAPIFFGREDEIVSIRTRLREQACRGCAFVLIAGPSGSGKSSLARAGVLPDVCQDEIDTDIRGWRWLAVKPSQLGDDLLGGLVRSLCADQALPELSEWATDFTPTDSSSFLEWKTLFRLRMGDALKSASRKSGPTRLIMLLDQMEELFSDNTITPTARDQLFEALEVLARSGSVWVLATVRSDFYHHCQTLPALLRMKEGAGWFDLLPPTPDALSRVITGPAMLAGLRFERKGDQALSDAILREAVEHKELLPLVEHLLLELCQHRSEDGTLTFAEFERLGGVEGALRQRCEETFAVLSSAAQASLDAVLSELVTLSGDGQEAFVRRTATMNQFSDDSVQRELIDAMVAARLFTTSSGADGSSVVSVAHEALLRVWPRAAQLIEANREHLRLRARVEQSQHNWEQRGEHDALLLPLGPPLDEGCQLLSEAPHLVSPSTRRYIDASIRFRDQQARQVRTEALVGRLLSAEPSQLPDIVGELDANPELTAALLAPLLAQDARTIDKKRSRLHARLALVSRDPSLIEPLVEELLTARVPYIVPIRWRLRPHVVRLRDELRGVLRDKSVESQRRFRAALALADYVPESEAASWSEQDVKYVAEQLVSANAEFQPLLRDALRPLHARLLGDLERIFGDSQASAAQRLGAANALADYRANDLPRLSQLLTLATPEQFDVLYPLVAAASSPTTVEQLAQIVATPPPDELGSRERIPFGQRRANAAVSLLRLGERETVLPVFHATDDPEALTQFVFRCRPRGVGADALLDCLRRVSDAPQSYPKDARYALLLALGEFRLDEVPGARRDALLQQLVDWHAHDPSSGVHGATGWLLREWGQAEAARKIDQTELPYSPQREWFTRAITVRPGAAYGSEASPPKTFYYTFIVFTPGTFQIGSTSDEPDREKKRETRHAVTLTRPFALLDRQITFEELIAFSPQYTSFMQEFDTKPADAGYGADWHDSVDFCRWLGEQSGMSESDQPYGEANLGDRNNRPIDVARSGFRLPTEAEWEIAARARARTAYGYGGDESLLARFGWFLENSGKHVHPPKELRPSVRGVFDFHGNLNEWTQDWYQSYGTEAATDPCGPDAGSIRMFRGGGWGIDAANCRSAYRCGNVPTYRSYNFGFRLALSPSGVSPEAGKGKNM